MKQSALIGAGVGALLGMLVMNHGCGPMFKSGEMFVVHFLVILFTALVGLLAGWVVGNK